MWEPREPQTLIQAAEKAAQAGDVAKAENLLRDAARLQEANLGPRHPDLANTLNNLGIVCEMTGKPDEAEQYFRRAVSIARTSLEPDHPFVATSQKNLRDFCESRGKQVELPAAVPEVQEPAPEVQELTPEIEQAAEEVHEVPLEVHEATVEIHEAAQEIPAMPEAEATTAPEQPPQPALHLEPEEDPEVTSRKFFTRVALGALGPIAMLMVILAAGLPRLGAPELNSLSSTVAAEPPREVPPPPAPAIVEPTPAPEETSPSTRPEEEEPEPVVSDATPAPAAARPVVVRASLCADLDEWSCDPADRPVPAGPLYFYTQIKSTQTTKIQHRWYQDNRLRQSVDLHVQANRTDGYRTYSRTLMNGDSAGNWKVEVRDGAGALLLEERFTVQ